VTTTSVAPVVPRMPVGARAATGMASRSRRPLPVAVLGGLSTRPADVIYAMSVVDKSGRLTDRSIVRALGWIPGTRLDVHERDGLIVVYPAADGVHCVSQRAFLKLPLTVRRWCGIRSGDRVLVAAHPATGVLVLHSLTKLHTLLTDGHAAALGGDAA
jgi:hypothetical protein